MLTHPASATGVVTLAERRHTPDRLTCFRVLFESLDSATALIAPTARYLAVNPAYAALLGQPAQGLVTRRFVESLHDDDRAGCTTLIDTLLTGGVEQAALRKRLVADGNQAITARLRFAAIREEGSDGPASALLVTAHPVNGEAPLAEAAPEVNGKHNGEPVFDLLAQMSHELRTPLNAIMGFSDLIRAETLGPVDARYREYADDINRSGQQLLTMITGILDSSHR
jgi:two-component system cell cycle sensor histidine kinase PleC